MAYRRLDKGSLYDFKEQTEFLLWKAGFDVLVETSFCYQYDDADNVEYVYTSKAVPTFQNEIEFEKAYRAGGNEFVCTRVCQGVREFSIMYNSEGLSYSFIMIHIKESEYQKNYGASFKLIEQDWSPAGDDLFTTFFDRLVVSFLTSYCDSQQISSEDIIRAAGEKYVYYLLCGDNQKKNLNIHNDINVLSSLQYEKHNNSGKIIIAKTDISACLDVALLEPVPIYQYKKARKLFEIAEDEVYLVGNSRAIYGIATRESLQKHNDVELLQLHIHGPLNWEILAYNPLTNICSSLIQYNNSHYCYKPVSCKIDEFKTLLVTKYPKADIDTLLVIVNEAIKQKHGTTIVFSPEAPAEADRLSKSCFRINPTKIQHITKQVTSIDGAVLCDMSGICYALGIILDGMSSESEDISRGARHNSAKRYKASHPESIICVISEDGGITFE